MFCWKSGIRLHCFRSRFTTSRSVEFCEVILFRALKIEITIRVHSTGSNVMCNKKQNSRSNCWNKFVWKWAQQAGFKIWIWRSVRSCSHTIPKKVKNSRPMNMCFKGWGWLLWWSWVTFKPFCYKKFNEWAQTANFSVLSRLRQELCAENPPKHGIRGKLKRKARKDAVKKSHAFKKQNWGFMLNQRRWNRVVSRLIRWRLFILDIVSVTFFFTAAYFC